MVEAPKHASAARKNGIARNIAAIMTWPGRGRPNLASGHPVAKDKLMRIVDDASAANHAADMRKCGEVNRRVGLKNGNVRDHPRRNSTSFGLHTESPGWILSQHRSEERRVGKECRSRWSPYH